jgi:cytochrome c-type biogenesis protein CcmH
MKPIQRLLHLVIIGLVLLSQPVLASEVELLESANAELYQELINELRCMVCQNQSIADSNAELARDFRNQVKEMLNRGESKEQISTYMVDRYGDYILYKPPFNPATALLWLGPFLLMIIGFVMIVRILRRHTPATEQTATADDVDKKAKLKAMLDNTDEHKTGD